MNDIILLQLLAILLTDQTWPQEQLPSYRLPVYAINNIIIFIQAYMYMHLIAQDIRNMATFLG